MQQVTIYNPGEIGSSRTRRMLTTVPATPQMRIKPKSFDPKMTSPCLLLGGKIKATVLAFMHVDSVGPEPGVGYGLSRGYQSPQKKKNDLKRFVESVACGASRSVTVPRS